MHLDVTVRIAPNKLQPGPLEAHRSEHDVRFLALSLNLLVCLWRRLYLGMEKRNGEVIMDASNKWSNLEYFKLTGLREYAPYMMGGG